MSTSVTGAHTIWVYLWEDDDAFNQDPGVPTENVSTDADQKIFGINETMDAQDRENNPERMFRPFSRSAEDIIETQFDGLWTADFVLTNSWWLQFFFGDPTVTEVTAGTEYEHFYETDPRTPPKTAHLIEETHYPSGNVEQVVYTGCAASSIDIDVATEDTVGISIDGLYAQDHTFNTGAGDSLPYGDGSTGIGTQPDTSYRAQHFGNSTLNVDIDEDSTPEFRRLIQDATITLEGNVEGEYELGSRIVAVPSYLQYEPGVEYTGLVGLGVEDGERRNAYGSQASTTQQETMEQAAIEASMVIDDGLALTDSNPVEFTALGNFPESYSRNNVGDPQETLEEDVSRMTQDIEVTVTSDLQTVG